jgi:hypothetical protein
MIFEDAFGGQLRAKPKRTRKENAILKIIDGPASRLRTWFLSTLEHRARVQLGVEAGVGIDWSKVDWEKLLNTILQLALVILKFVAIFGNESPEGEAVRTTEIVTRKTRTTSKRVKDW